MKKEFVLNQSVCDFSRGIDIAQTILIYLVALFVPTFLGMILNQVFGVSSVVAMNSQLIIGSIVNTALFVTALNLKGTVKILGIVTMPSVSTILSGVVFHSASVYMSYMIPAIWLGNFSLIYFFKKMFVVNKKNYLFAGIVSILIKVFVIFGIFQVLRMVSIFPDALVSTLQTSMGMTQLITAFIGFVLSFAIFKLQGFVKKS